MASLLKLRRQQPSFKEIYLQAQKEAEENRVKEYNAAVCIQSCFRGYMSRNRLTHLRDAATRMQKLYRGWLDRKKFRAKVLTEYRSRCLNTYNNAATCIQRHWKGYYSRKTRHNYYARRAYLRAVQEQHDIIAERQEMQRVMDEAKKLEQKRLAKEQRYRDLNNRTHHLISTTHIQGVYAEKKDKEDELRATIAGLTLVHQEERKRTKPIGGTKGWYATANGWTTNGYRTGAKLAAVTGPIPNNGAVTHLNETRDRRSVLISSPWKTQVDLQQERDRIARAKSLGDPTIHRGNPTARPLNPYTPAINAGTSYTTKWGHGYGLDTFRDLKRPPTTFHTATKEIKVFDDVNFPDIH
jgi:hypothetical protein